MRPQIIEQKSGVLKGPAHSNLAHQNGANSGRNFSVNRNSGSFAMGHHKPASTSFIQKDIKSINKSVIHPSLTNHASRTASLYNNAH